MSQPVLIGDSYHRVLKMMASMPNEDRTMGGIIEDQLKQLGFSDSQIAFIYLGVSFLVFEDFSLELDNELKSKGINID